MAGLKALEERVAKLEQALALLQQQLARANGLAAGWTQKVAGIVTDDEAFEEAMAYGRAWRQADRPPDDAAEQP
jgi:hypothetical protein